MNKLLTLILALSFCLLISAQNADNKPTPPQGGETAGPQALSMVKAPPPNKWSCNIDFYYDGNKAYSEQLSQNDKTDFRGSLAAKFDNKIDEIVWKGSRCNCWVVVYQQKNFQGLNAGFWTFGTSGNYELSYYNTYDFVDKKWERWDQVVSSYSIYCF